MRSLEYMVLCLMCVCKLDFSRSKKEKVIISTYISYKLRGFHFFLTDFDDFLDAVSKVSKGKET